MVWAAAEMTAVTSTSCERKELLGGTERKMCMGVWGRRGASAAALTSSLVMIFESPKHSSSQPGSIYLRKYSVFSKKQQNHFKHCEGLSSGVNEMKASFSPWSLITLSKFLILLVWFRRCYFLISRSFVSFVVYLCTWGASKHAHTRRWCSSQLERLSGKGAISEQLVLIASTLFWWAAALCEMTKCCCLGFVLRLFSVAGAALVWQSKP